MEFPGVHAVHRINRLAGARFAPSTCVHPRGSLAGSLGLNDRNSMEPATLSDGNNKKGSIDREWVLSVPENRNPATLNPPPIGGVVN